jgi:hypothetical protein
VTSRWPCCPNDSRAATLPCAPRWFGWQTNDPPTPGDFYFLLQFGLHGHFSSLVFCWSFYGSGCMNEQLMKSSCCVGSGAVTFSPRRPAGLLPVLGWNFAS